MGELSQMVRGKGLSAVGFVVLAIFGLMAVLVPIFSPYAPAEMDVPMSPPSGRHLLGTDDVGHDILGELFHGARFSLLAGLISGALSTIIGIFVGLVAGYYERLGFAIMRIVDVFLAVPRFPLIVFLAAFLKPGLWTLVLVFVLFGWPGTSRLVRSRVLSERTSGYVDAARVVGADDPHIILRHLLPSSVPIALTRFIVEFQHVILAESGLSFLGLGDPATKSWGMMLHYAFQYPTIFISDVWIWWAVPPGLCITLVVLALTFSGFSLEEWANPRLRKSRPALRRTPNLHRRLTNRSPLWGVFCVILRLTRRSDRRAIILNRYRRSDMAKAYCPNCDSDIIVEKPRMGAMITCGDCGQELEVISVSPFEVDFPLDDSWDDDDEDED